MRAINRGGFWRCHQTVEFIVLLGSLVWPGEAGAEPKRINIGYLTVSSGYAVLWVTKEAGIFHKNGLDADLIYIPPAILTQAMVARQVPIAVSGGSSMIEANLRGADFVLLGSLTQFPSLNFFVTRPELREWSNSRVKDWGSAESGRHPIGYYS
jgi:ABC-type nitrate/sulfonate/bicarbonate transport system substrate-binding protein